MGRRNCISFGVFSYYLLIPFLIPLIRQIRSISLKYLDVRDQRKDHPFIMTGIMFFAEMIAGSIELINIIRKRSQKPSTEQKNKIQQMNLLFYQKRKISAYSPETESTLKPFLLILAAALLDLIGTTGLSIATQSIGENMHIRFQLKGFQMLYFALLCYCILKYKIYRHHVFAIIIIVISVVPINYNYYNTIEWRVFLVILLSLFPVGVKQTTEKYLMHISYFSPFKILFFEGLFGFIMSVIMISIASNVKCPVKWCQGRNFEDPVKFYNDLNVNGIIFLFVIHILCLAGINSCNFLVIKQFTPTHVLISDVLVSIVDWIALLISGGIVFSSFKEITLPLIGYIVLFFGCLVYNEIIILHFCRLGNNTKTKIAQRSRLDYEETNRMNLIDYDQVKVLELVDDS